MWGEAPPTSSRKVIQGSVVRLRRFLGAEAIATVEGGYRLDVPTPTWTAGHFQAQVERARAELREGYAERAVRASRRRWACGGVTRYSELAQWPPADRGGPSVGGAAGVR